MTIFKLPVTPSPDKIYTVNLDEVSYDIRLQYLLRSTNLSTKEVTADQFLMQIRLTGDEDWAIRTSLKTNRDVLAQYHHLDACPQGTLVLRDYIADSHYFSTALEGAYNPERVTYEELGNRFILIYNSDVA